MPQIIVANMTLAPRVDKCQQFALSCMFSGLLWFLLVGFLYFVGGQKVFSVKLKDAVSHLSYCIRILM